MDWRAEFAEVYERKLKDIEKRWQGDWKYKDWNLALMGLRTQIYCLVVTPDHTISEIVETCAELAAFLQHSMSRLPDAVREYRKEAKKKAKKRISWMLPWILDGGPSPLELSQQ